MISQSSTVRQISEVTQQIENIPNTQVTVLEDSPVGSNVVCFPTVKNNK